MSSVIDGKLVAAKIRSGLGRECAELFRRLGKRPNLVIILVGDDPASLVYVASKERACAEIGIQSQTVRLPSSISEDELIKRIDEVCLNPEVNGVMLQLPLPRGLDSKKAIERIPAEKDVDGLTALSAGKLFHSEKALIPCTPKGIVRLLKEYNVPLQGAHAVVVGRSNLVGKPLSMMLLNENCTVTVCHSKTKNLFDITKSADILIAAVGIPYFIAPAAVKKGVVVVDVGINRVDGKLCGDVEYDGVSEMASLITPVPGGVGPMTVAMLLDNTVQAFCDQNGLIRI